MSGSVARPFRILHVIQNLNYGGMEKVMTDLLRGLNPGRFECHVLTLQYVGRFGREAGLAARVHEGPTMSRLSLLRPVALSRALRELRPSIVHTHSGVWYKTARAARIAGIRGVVHTEHGRQSDALLARVLDRRAAHMTDRVVAVSRPLGTYLVTRLRIPDGAITIVPNGVDTEHFKPGPRVGTLRPQLGIAPDAPMVGSIGRLEPVKGYDVLLRAFQLVSRSAAGRRSALVVAGEGSARPSLEALTRELGIHDRVYWLGWRDDPGELLREFDCFALGSRSEGTSISLLEALATGLPPAVTDVGGNADVLGPELRRQLAPSENPGALADRILAALDPHQREGLGEGARRRVEQAFSLRIMVGRYEALYEELLRGAVDGPGLRGAAVEAPPTSP
jgi:glycosyltransferase involved in cell wall biosynthesis